MTDSELTAIAAHLHVLLRRLAGRVTDIEWMAANHEYAVAMAGIAKAKARELGSQDLELWALKLEMAWLERRPSHKPLVQRVNENMQNHGARASGFKPSTLPSGFGDSVPAASRFQGQEGEPARPDENDPDAPRYVGGLR
jgi:predicted component of type VI protein secretion system